MSLDVVRDQDSVNSARFEDHSTSYNPEELNFYIEIEPFVFVNISEIVFDDDLSVSFNIEKLIAALSNDLSSKLNDVLFLFIKILHI